MKLSFTIPGPPVAKGRPRLGRHGAYTPPKTAEYEKLVRLSYIRQCGREMLSGYISAGITACFPIPKSASKKARAAMLAGELLPDKKPDLDNIAKAVLDALNGVAYEDDSRITRLWIGKRYSETPEVRVTLAGGGCKGGKDDETQNSRDA